MHLRPCARRHVRHCPPTLAVRKLIDESTCLYPAEGTSALHPCSPQATAADGQDARIRTRFTGLPSHRGAGEHRGCELCYHGAHMIPWLMRRYRIHSLVEVGVCTGLSVANVVTRLNGAFKGSGDTAQGGHHRAGSLERYYMVDPWGSNRCRPGCGCSRQIREMSSAWPDVLVPLRGYSVKAAAHIPNGTLDLAFIDAAHDYRNVRNDVLAYWSKLKPTGIMAGHDFGRGQIPMNPSFLSARCSALARPRCPRPRHLVMLCQLTACCVRSMLRLAQLRRDAAGSPKRTWPICRLCEGKESLRKEGHPSGLWRRAGHSGALLQLPCPREVEHVVGRAAKVRDPALAH
jgi:hypothetical protein